MINNILSYINNNNKIFNDNYYLNKLKIDIDELSKSEEISERKIDVIVDDVLLEVNSDIFNNHGDNVLIVMKKLIIFDRKRKRRPRTRTKQIEAAYHLEELVSMLKQSFKQRHNLI